MGELYKSGKFVFLNKDFKKTIYYLKKALYINPHSTLARENLQELQSLFSRENFNF